MRIGEAPTIIDRQLSVQRRRSSLFQMQYQFVRQRPSRRRRDIDDTHHNFFNTHKTNRPPENKNVILVSRRAIR
jgi:hypothetical protein